MPYAALAVTSALLFALTFLFRKQAVSLIPVQLAFLVESIFYIIIPLILFIVMPVGERKAALHNSQGILYALLAGIFVFIGVGLNYLALKEGYLSKVISITSPAQILFGVLLGILLLKENLSAIQILGVFFSIIGVLLLTR